MKFNLPVTVLVAALGLGAPAFMLTALAADKNPTTKPAKAIRVPKPYSAITTLTDEQKRKIANLHSTALAEIKKITEKEAEDITSLLSDEQKQELEKLKEAETAARKAKEGAPKEPTTKDGAGK